MSKFTQQKHSQECSAEIAAFSFLFFSPFFMSKVTQQEHSQNVLLKVQQDKDSTACKFCLQTSINNTQTAKQRGAQEKQ